MKNKIQVGQKIFLKPIGNKSRYTKEIKTGIVSEVGRKYFKIEGWHRVRFFIDKMVNDGCGYVSNWACYFSMQEIKDEDEMQKLNNKLRELFRSYRENGLSLSQLRKITEIIAN